MRRYVCLFVFLLIRSVVSQAQSVWPGDVNDNGVVNGVDVLYVGLAYGKRGPERVGGSRSWEAQNISSLWGTAFPGGLDYAYADCNGDGQIDGNDLYGVISENFGLTHGAPQADGFSKGSAGAHPPLILQPETTGAEWGAALNIDLRLGAETFPAANFYGIALVMSYNADLVDRDADEEGFDFELDDDAWISRNDDDEVRYLFHKDHDRGRAELAITRINQRSVRQGSGIIGQFSVVVEDIIVGSETEIDTFVIQIDSVLYLDDQFNVYPVVADKALIVIRDGSLSVSDGNEQPPPEAVKIYPNPAEGYFIIDAQRNLDRVRAYNAIGELMPLLVRQNALNRMEIGTDQWPAGLYYLELSSGNQTFIKKMAVVSGQP